MTFVMSDCHKTPEEKTSNGRQKTTNSSDTTDNATNMDGLCECYGAEVCPTAPAGKFGWGAKRDDSHACLAQKCVRFGGRRNALNDPELMAMKQETRERLESDIQQRRQTVKYKVNKALGKLHDGQNEVDLI